MASASAWYDGLLGESTWPVFAVAVVPIPGPVRGAAGHGVVIVDPQEVESLDDCDEFRQSAGVDGTCGRWVLAHEVAHQWFGPGPRARPGDRLVWESIADYLALDWWRDTYGAADHARLVDELLVGRMDLDPAAVLTTTPSSFDRGDDLAERAVLRGRGSMAWIAAERAAGRAQVGRVLREVLAAGGPLTIDRVRGDRRRGRLDEALTLVRWWLDPTFDPFRDAA